MSVPSLVIFLKRQNYCFEEEKKMSTWREFRGKLEITPEDEKVIEYQKSLTKTKLNEETKEALVEARQLMNDSNSKTYLVDDALKELKS